MAAYLACLAPGGCILGMNLSHGGHLTHGSPVNFSGRFFRVASYGVRRETGRIDYDEVAALAREHRPAVIVAGASAYPRRIDFARFRAIADETGAKLVVDMAHIAGLVAVGLHESPIPHAHITTTTTHKTLRGPRGGMLLSGEDMSRPLDSQIFPGIQGGPLMHVVAAKAVAFKLALEPSFKDYQKQILANAKTLADALMEYGFDLVSKGTDNHMMLVDLRPKALTGKLGEHLLHEAGITSNKNAIPFDPEKPMITSGLRFGTAAVTTRGMAENEMIAIADAINDVLSAPNDEAVRKATRKKMADICCAFPLYSKL
jgi:glycine hydroxymethyltransferase